MRFSLAACLVLWCAAVSAGAQSMGGVTGSVADQTGAPLPGAQVTIRGVAAHTAETGAAGDFAFQGLPAGDYEIAAELSGFERARRDVRVTAGERVTVALTLRVVLMETTIVTAARTGGRDVQEIPLAISAVSPAGIERLGAQTIEHTPALAPSVTFSQNTGWGQLTIRGIGANLLFAGSDPSSAMYLDGVYLARPAMVFAQFLDLDRIEVLRGPQGTLYGRNAVGGAVNLIPRPPTNDLQAAARLTAGNFGELRADARLSGPLKRDRVMGAVAFARGVRDGFVRDLEHPDHPLGSDDVTAARGQLQVVFDRRTNLLLSTDVDHQGGVPLTYNKVLAAKPGYQFDNPPDFHDVRSDPRLLGRHAALRRERPPDDGPDARHHAGQPDRVSCAGLRVLRGFRQHRARSHTDVPARAAASMVGGDHDLAPAARADLGGRRVSLQRIGSPVSPRSISRRYQSRSGSTRR